MNRYVLAGALFSAIAMVGCVSTKSLEKDLASGESERITSAEAKMVSAATTGKADFSSFNLEERVWCAKNLKSKAALREALSIMSRRQSWNPQNTSRDKIQICLGMSSDLNTPVVSALLENIGPDDAVADLLASGQIDYSSSAYAVAQQYMENYVLSVDDKARLYAMTRLCYNWNSKSSYFQRDMYERILPMRLVSLVSTAAEVKEFLQSNASISADLKKAAIGKVKNQSELLGFLDDRDVRSFVIGLITDQALLYDLALNENDATWQWEGNSSGEQALAKITDKTDLVKLVLLAKNKVIVQQATNQLGDRRLIVNGLADLIKKGELSADVVNSNISSLKNGEATIDIYDAIGDKEMKRLVFSKLSVADRATVRARDVTKCESLIAKAEGVANKTFTLGGFYLGMDIEDAEMLIGYYFPEWSNAFGYEGEDKEKMVLGVPQQDVVFARANKDGKVWQLNFGKTILAKWFQYDAARYEDWADAFSRENRVALKFDILSRTDKVTVVTGMNGWSPTTETVLTSLNQTIWTYKSAAKHYRLTYFGEPEIIAFGGGQLGKAAAKDKYRYISADAGTLRAAIEND